VSDAAGQRLRRALVDGPAAETNGLRVALAAAVLLHLGLAFGRPELWGGGDLVPHLRLIELTRQDPGLHNTYAPAYHLLGAALSPVLGAALFTRVFAVAAAGLLMAGFRAFQRAAGLPDTCTALFVLTPYLLSFSWCTPRIEAAGYGLMLLGLAALLRGRGVPAALALAACFWVHTASALLFGLSGGVLCLARRDARGLAVLAAGTALAAPLVIAQVAAGCSFAEALLFARGGYARGLHERLIPPNWPWLLPLANPIAVPCAVLGAATLWRRQRALGILCAVLVVFYLNNLWLAPFGRRTLVTLLRGLSVLSIPVAVAAGLYAARAPRLRAAVVAGSLGWALFAAVRVVPEACFVRRVTVAETRDVRVDRCTFRWRQPAASRHPAPGARFR
jgi:hypothetical protein